MIYEYRCECGNVFDVHKSHTLMKRPEYCEKCSSEAVRAFVPSKVYFNGTKVENAEFNPGLGCIVRNKEHRKELCKMKGLEEIGNEKPESIHKHFEKVREENREKAWEEVDKGWVGNGDIGT